MTTISFRNICAAIRRPPDGASLEKSHTHLVVPSEHDRQRRKEAVGEGAIGVSRLQAVQQCFCIVRRHAQCLIVRRGERAPPFWIDLEDLRGLEHDLAAPLYGGMGTDTTKDLPRIRANCAVDSQDDIGL